MNHALRKVYWCVVIMTTRNFLSILLRELSFQMLGTGVEESFIQIANFSYPMN